MYKKYIIIQLIVLFGISHTGSSQVKIDLNTGFNISSIRENSGNPELFRVPFLGYQAGLGLIYPFNQNWFIHPGLWYFRAGEAYRDSVFTWGSRNDYIRLYLNGGFSYNLGSTQQIRFSAGPALNYWAGSILYDGFTGLEQHMDMINTEGINRFFLSGGFKLSYGRPLGPFDLNIGVEGNLGLTPIESYDDFSGNKIKYTTHDFGLNVALSIPWDNLLGKSLNPKDYTIDIEPEELASGSLFDKTNEVFKKARKLVNDAYYTDPPDSTAKDLAVRALEKLELMKKLLREGINAWDNGDEGGIGPETAKSFKKFLRELEERATVMVDSVFTVPPETDKADDDPRDIALPVMYGEEIDPPWVKVAGAMQPTQGVWQDDKIFIDKPSKRIIRENQVSWQAELDMVAGRWTAVYGLKHDDYILIKMEGTSTYSHSVPVKFRLQLIQGKDRKIIWTQPGSHFSIPIEGPTGPEINWKASLTANEGAPVPKTFKMKPGAYVLELELVREDGTETGIKISTHGFVAETAYPVVQLVPVLLSNDWTRKEVIELAGNAKRLALECERELDVFFPVKQNGMTVTRATIQYLANRELGTLDQLTQWLTGSAPEETKVARKDRVIATLVQKYATGSQLSNGAKVIVLINDADFGKVRKNASRAVAFTPHNKVIFVRMTEDYTTVAHELVHATPYLWSKTQMIRDCELNYHNNADNNYANGAKVESWGASIRKDKPAVMGSVAPGPYVTQCTYWHLLQEMKSPIDPELFVVSGYIARKNASFNALLEPTFETEGISALSTGTILPGGWGIVLRDVAGLVLKSFPFEPVWKFPDTDTEHNLIAFNYRVERLPETATIQLLGPEGVLDEQTVSANAPQLHIIRPSGGKAVKPLNNKVRIEWKASDKDGDKLTYVLLCSDDGGISWQTLENQWNNEGYELDIQRLRNHIYFRVIATDGVRSAEDEVRFSLKE